MKILILTNAMDAGGAETHVLTLAEGLYRWGHEVWVSSSGGRMVERLTALGVRHVCVPLSSPRPDRLWRARRALARLLESESFDIVHAHARIPAFLVANLARRHGACFVTTAHADFRDTPLRRRLSRWGYATVAVSEDLAMRLCERYRDACGPITVIPNGIDTDFFCPPKDEKENREFHILCMSRLDRDCASAARMLCRLAPRLHREIPNLVITIAGGGDAYDTIVREAVKVRKTSGAQIHAVGHVSDPRPLLQGCDVFVGVSRAALEAMACGRCVILGGDEGFLGVLNEEGAMVAARENLCARGYGKLTEDKLFAAIRTLWQMGKSERTSCGEGLRRYVMEKQSARGMVEKTESFYEAVRERVSVGGHEVLLCGYYGFGNVGDDALLCAAIARAREKFPRSGVTALTRRGERDEWRFGIPCVRRDRPFAVMRAIRCAEVVVFGGGTLLQDATSRRSLSYYTWILRYAQDHGVACELWGNGIGALLHRGSEKKVARVLSGCRYVGLRDDFSMRVGRTLMGTEAHKLVREEDLAMGTRPSSPARIDALLARIGATGPKGAVAVAVRGGATSGVLRTMREWLCLLSAEGYTLCFFSLYPKEDEALTERLCRTLGGVHLRGVGASDLVGLFGHCEAVCAMRLHALVFAATAGTPFVGFGTDGKIESFCREHGGVYYVDLYAYGE